MSKQAPAQLFDNSEQENLNQTPELKSKLETPASAPQPNADVYDPNDAQWRDFDEDAYLKRAKKRLPAGVQWDEDSPDLRAQLWLARHLSPAVVQWIAHDLPTKSLWEHLGADELKPLRYEALRGFQQTPGSLRREPVQKRIAAWLGKQNDETHLLLLRWALQNSQPPVLRAVAAQRDEATFKGRLPSLLRSFGPNAVSAAVAFGGVTRRFELLRELIGDEAKLAEILKDAAPYSIEVEASAAPESELEAPQPDSPAAQFWRDQAVDAAALLRQVEAKLRELAQAENRAARALERVAKLEAELEIGKKREAKQTKQFEKKLEQSERKWADKFGELSKLGAREERRARALQSQIETLELDNKRGKKQLRQSAQSREEERRKVVALDARLADLNADLSGDQPAAKTKAMDALSSPPTTQDAPNRPVKVSKPSPLDEIFEWQAQGQRIRLTAREVRRLIDKNDEASVGKVMMELEFLRETNPELRRRFLERLSLAGTHYARVLTHRTTRVLVDASNVARARKDRYGKGLLVNLQLMRQELQRLDCWPIVFVADASLPYNIDAPAELREMAKNGEIILTDKGIEADEVLARQARATGAYVVTNDAKFFYKVSPDYEPPRLAFRVMEGLVTVDEF